MVTAVLPPDELDEGRSSIVPEADQRFGRYHLCYELASGGMGKVFLARAEGARSFEKLVALKRIHPHLAERKQFVDMFLDEARITSRIAHPNVCSVFDFGHEGGTYYLAMEYLFGEPLSHVMRGSLRRDPNDPQRIPHIARILADACEGLHAAHELEDADGNPLGVVHRDVSPHNIFVTYDGSVKVVDFGIARAADQLHETTTGAVKGKWAYMAPEQARAQAMDRRVDVWALGVVLWEGATGRRLFRRSTQTETVLALVNDPIPRPSAIEPSVPPEIDEICMRALSRDPDMRWPSARAMGRAIRHYLASRGSPVGLAELAEWMEELFPGIRDRKQALVGALAEPVLPPPGESVETMAMLPSHLVEKLEELDMAPRRTRKASVSTVREGLLRPKGHAAPEAPPPRLAAAMDALPPIDTAHEAAPTPALAQAPPSGTPWLRRTLAVGGLVAAATLMGAGGAWLVAPPDQPDVPPVAVAATEAASRTESVPPSPDVPEVEDPDESTPSTADVPDEAAPPEDTETVEEAERDDETSTRDAVPPPSRSPRPAARAVRPRPAPEVPPSAPPTPAREEGEGTVNLVTVGGWALVFEGGRSLGETPAQLTLPAGRHILEIRPFGRTPGRRVTVNVRPGVRERVAIPIESPP